MFPNEPIKAYLYIGAPVSAISGILYLGKRHVISDWAEKFRDDRSALKRIREYQKKQRYAMEILKFEETNVIPLMQLRNEIDNFVVPQMYYYLTDTELLEYLEKRIIKTGLTVEHSFENITSNDVCHY